MSKLQDLRGQKFGKLLVLELHSVRTKYGNKQWFCLCDCGKNTIVSGGNLKRGHTQSCGCLRVEFSTNQFTHQKTGTKEYQAWNHLKVRCSSFNFPDSHRYSGRGIKVCERWKDSFMNFLEDMGYAPSPKHSIDRYPNNDGNYEPGNCRWATQKEQMENSTRPRYDIIDGLRMNRVELSLYIGISNPTLIKYYNKGFNIEQIRTHFKNKRSQIR